MERTECRAGRGVGLGMAVKGAEHAGGISGLGIRGQKESHLQDNPEEREGRKMGGKMEAWSIDRNVPAPSQPEKHFHPGFACVQISERPLLITNLPHSRRDSKILNIG